MAYYEKYSIFSYRLKVSISKTIFIHTIYECDNNNDETYHEQNVNADYILVYIFRK